MRIAASSPNTLPRPSPAGGRARRSAVARTQPERSGPCRGPSRRSLLRAGMLTAFGLGLDDLFRLPSLASGAGGTKPTKVKHCILVWLAGGASHIDTFAPKPDAPPDVKGEFKP